MIGDTVNFETYVGDGVSTIFPFPHRFLVNSDIKVYLNAVIQVAGFTVSGAGGPVGGNITFSVAPANGASIFIIDDPSLIQETDFVNNVTILEDNLNDALDRTILAVQAMDYKLGRSIRGAVTDDDVPTLDFTNNPETLVYINNLGIPTLADVELLISGLPNFNDLFQGRLSAPWVGTGPGNYGAFFPNADFNLSVSPTLDLRQAGVGLQQVLRGSASLTGDAGAAVSYAPFVFGVVSDNVEVDTGNDVVGAMLITHSFGGAAMFGARETLRILSNMTANSNVANFNPQYVCATFEMIGSVSDNNNAGYFGFNPRVLIAPGLGVINEATGEEVDVSVQAGTTPVAKHGVSVFSMFDDAGFGSVYDAGYSIGTVTGGRGFQNGLLLHLRGGAQGVHNTGNIIKAQGAHVFANAFDFTDTIFTNGILLTNNGILIDGIGRYNLPNNTELRMRNVADTAFDGSIFLNLADQLSINVNNGVLLLNAAVGAFFSGSLFPQTTDVLNIGNASFRFANIFATGLVGTITNNNAAAGNVGEFISSGQSGGLTPNVVDDVSSISLTAGDWDVWGNMWFSFPDDTAVTTRIRSWISIVSATQPVQPNEGAHIADNYNPGLTGVLLDIGAFVGQIRISLSATTTVYLSTLATFTGSIGSVVANGFIAARRVR